MISARRLTILAIVGVLVLGILACGPDRGPAKLLDECRTDVDCLEGLFCCDDRCHECCEDYDCDEDAGERCSDEHTCFKVGDPPPPAVAPAPLGADCETVRCQEGLHCCDDAKCHECCYPIHCDEGEGCHEYKCVPRGDIPPPPAGGLGARCPTDPDCQEGLHCCDDARCHECCEDGHCCDLHPGEVWDCTEGDYTCVKVGCDAAEDCEEICPTGQWECDPDFGDCVKAAPAPEPECSSDEDCTNGVCDQGTCVGCAEDAVVEFVIYGEPGQEFWAARYPEEGEPTWPGMKQRFCEDPTAFEDLHGWNLIPATAGADGKATITIPGNSWWSVLGRTLGDDRSPSGICAIMASDWYEVTEQMQCPGAQVDVPGVEPVFECIEGCSELP